MTTEPIIESGMTFGLYPEGHCFYIEKSQTYGEIQSGVKIAEFLLLHPKDKPVVWIIEAKSSSPRPETQPNFDDFIKEICEKLTNALTLCVATCLKRHSSTYHELPTPFQELALDQVSFRLILVINGHQDKWLPPLQEAVAKALKPTVKMWGLSPNSVVVMNHTTARSEKLMS